MTYKETLRFLFESLPMYQRIGAAAYKADLNNTIALLLHLNNPQKRFKSVHVAGTNGKGSVSHNLASILQEQSLKVGLYTSPHLSTFRERILIDGTMISKQYVTDFVDKHKVFFDSLHLSFFEMTVGMAFQYFADNKVDIAVVETGMGGRLDSTNLVYPLLSIITNIDYDHMHFLGNTLDKIAAEKAGIIKERVPVVIGETHSETKEVFLQTAENKQAPIVFADQIYTLKNVERKMYKHKPLMTFDLYKNNTLYRKRLATNLTGIYQEKNFGTLAAACDLLSERIPLSAKAFSQGIKNCMTNTSFKGRWQCLETKPLCIADIGHNVAGIKMICQQLESLSYRKLHFVIGVVNDKDINAMLALLPKDATYYFCKAKIPRGLKALILKEKAKQYQLHGQCYRSVRQAYRIAKQQAGKNDVVFVGGSAFTVAEVL